MELNGHESALVEAFRRLPPDAAGELSGLVQRLAALGPNTRIDWSDSWSEEDLREFTAQSLKRLGAEEDSP
jgi:hypothetical protein